MTLTCSKEVAEQILKSMQELEEQEKKKTAENKETKLVIKGRKLWVKG